MQIKQILNRFYVHDLDQAIEFYEKLLNQKCNRRFKFPQTNLELAQIGDLLLLAGSEEALQPVKNVQATFIVDSINEFKEFLLTKGATIIRDIKQVPTGRSSPNLCVNSLGQKKLSEYVLL